MVFLKMLLLKLVSYKNSVHARKNWLLINSLWRNVLLKHKEQQVAHQLLCEKVSYYQSCCKKESVFGVILVRIFPAFFRIRTEYGEIRRDTERCSVSLRIQSKWGKMREKCGPEWLRIWTLFTQWHSL